MSYSKQSHKHIIQYIEWTRTKRKQESYRTKILWCFLSIF